MEHNQPRSSAGEQRVQAALAQFSVGTTPCNLAFPGDSLETGNGVFSAKPVKQAIAELIERGYPHYHSFLVLPNSRSPRWLVPWSNFREAVTGFQIYQPYTHRGRMLKSLFVGALRMGWRGAACPSVLIASRQPLPIEELVGELTGETKPCFSLALGEPSIFCKVTVQVMRSTGEILGYLKIPLSEKAGERIRHEVETLARLASIPALRPCVARVLHAGEWHGRYISFQSPGPMQACKPEFTRVHTEFLQKLWDAFSIRRPGAELVNEVAARWSKVEPKLDPEWRTLGQKTLARARQDLGAKSIACGPSHGDFGPWHVRKQNGRIFVFDWEWAKWDVPNLWDVLNFNLGTRRFWDRRVGRSMAMPSTAGTKGVYLLYLLSSLCMPLEGGLSTTEPGCSRRRRLIENEL